MGDYTTQLYGYLNRPLLQGALLNKQDSMERPYLDVTLRKNEKRKGPTTNSPNPQTKYIYSTLPFNEAFMKPLFLGTHHIPPPPKKN